MWSGIVLDPKLVTGLVIVTASLYHVNIPIIPARGIRIQGYPYMAERTYSDETSSRVALLDLPL